ncbi:MAG TPA: hypothetical protein VH761_15035 [Ilumatobacteraceae bacterium]|jgi:hypothetical protein
MSDRTELATGTVESRMSAMLAVLQRADAKGEPADNESIANALGWDLDETAVIVHSARESLLVWGLREGRKPGPWYSSLELTVQGRRYLRERA